MRILFLHGWHSAPGGVKPTYLKDHSHEVLNPALPDDDFDEAVRIAQAEFDQHHPDVVVGSSRGGAVAMNIKSGSTPLVLLCPAWKKWGTARTLKPGTIILHSGADDVVPFGDSLELVRNSGLPESALVVVGYEHRLADDESLAAMLEAVERVSAPRTQAIAHEAHVPRQFGIRTLLLITTMYAVLFSILKVLIASPLDVACVVSLFTLVGLGQILLFNGQRPRMASVIVGACVPWIVVLPFELVIEHRLARIDPVGGIWGTIFSAFYGYLAGRLIAGVFLLADKVLTFMPSPRRTTGPKGQEHSVQPQTPRQTL